MTPTMHFNDEHNLRLAALNPPDQIVDQSFGIFSWCEQKEGEGGRWGSKC